jgi:hypothetical protein
MTNNNNNQEEEQKQPSANFMNTLNDVRNFLNPFLDEKNIMKYFSGTDEEFEAREQELKSKLDRLEILGEKEGLNHNFIKNKVEEYKENCMDCNQQITIYKSLTHPNKEALCSICQDKEDRQDFKERQDKARNKKISPIEHYCNVIRNITPNYELTYEEYKELGNKSEEYRNKLRDEDIKRNKILHDKIPKPEGINKTKWERQQRRIRRMVREEIRQEEKDSELELHSTPSYLFSKVIDEIGCECKGEEIRAGNYCNTCKLLVRVNEYLHHLFKAASQGRSTII